MRCGLTLACTHWLCVDAGVVSRGRRLTARPDLDAVGPDPRHRQRQQPVARDLRRIITILLIAGELERIGDYAEGIAKINEIKLC